MQQQPVPQFDPLKFKQATKEQWDATAEPWYRWGPVIERWLGEATQLMLDMAGVQPGSRVLDVAAGAGGQTVAAAQRVSPTGSVMATDIAPKILEYAAKRAADEGLKVETSVADSEALDKLNLGRFDAAVCRLGLMFFPDGVGALRGINRLLTVGGRFAAVVFSTADKNEFFSVPISIARRHAHLTPPAPEQPGPFNLGPDGRLEGVLQKAGFRAVEVRRVSAPLQMDSLAEFVRFQRDAFAFLHQMLSSLSDSERASAWAEMEGEMRRFEGPSGFHASCELLIGAGMR